MRMLLANSKATKIIAATIRQGHTIWCHQSGNGERVGDPRLSFLGINY
ncbi:MAG: hypothetical protein AAF346_05640 [Pseudomonadota bacterium]